MEEESRILSKMNEDRKILKKMEEESKSKQQRAANFSPIEKATLLELVSDEKDIILSKGTDHVSVNAKVTAWNNIEKMYNAQPQVCKRTAKQLHTLFVNMKRRARKEIRMLKNGVNGVEGPPRLSDNTRQLCRVLDNKNFAMQSNFDSDTSNSGQVEDFLLENDLMETSENNEGNMPEEFAADRDDGKTLESLKLQWLSAQPSDSNSCSSGQQPRARKKAVARGAEDFRHLSALKLRCVEKEAAFKEEERGLRRRVLEMEYEAAKSKRDAYKAKREYYEVKKVVLLG